MALCGVYAMAALACLPTGCSPAGVRKDDPAFAKLPARKALASGAPARAASVSRFRLDNGLRVVLQEDHSARVVALQAWVDVGAADDPEELSGVAHVLEHTLFSSTERRGPSRIAREIEAVGGQIGAFTSLDHTVYHLLLASRFLDTGLDVLADALQAATFDARDLSRELRAIAEEIAQADESPSRVATQALFVTAYRRHPYRHAMLGTQKTVLSLTRDRVREYFLHHYVAGRITLVACGDFDRAALQHKIETAFAGLRRGPQMGKNRPERIAEPTQQELRVVASDHGGHETQLILGFHGPPVGSPDSPALVLAAAILGQGEAARLPSEAHRNRGAVSEVHAYSYAPRDPGMLVISASLPTAQLGEATALLLGEVFRLTREEVGTAELNRALTLLLSEQVRVRETAQGRARRLGDLIAGDADDQAQADRLRAVTPSALRAALARYLIPTNLTLSVAQPRAQDVPQKLPGRPRPSQKSQALLDAVSFADKGRVKRLLRGLVTMAQVEGDINSPNKGHATLQTSTLPGAEQVIVHRLRSGARLLILPDPGVPLIALRALWPGGMRADEDEHTAGASYLLARLLTRGTRTRNAEQLRGELAALPGTLSGVSDEDLFGLRAELLSQGPDRGLEQGLRLLADCVKNPSFAEDEVEAERRRLLSRLHATEDDAGQMVLRVFLKALYPRHPYRLDPQGTPQSVAALSRRRLAEFYHRHYPISGMTLVVVGDVRPAQVIERAEALLAPDPGPPTEAAGVARPPAPAVEPAVNPKDPVQVFKYLHNKQQAHLILGFRGVSLGAPDRYPLEVLGAVLSGQGGRLAVELHDRRGLLYRVKVLSMMGSDPGYLGVYFSSSPQKLEAAQAAVRDELRKLVDHYLSKEELSRAKQHLIGVHEIRMQRRSELAAELASHEALGVPFREHLAYADRVFAVDAAAVQRVARRYLDEERSVVAAVLPESMTPAAGRRSLRESPVSQVDPRPAPVGDGRGPSRKTPASRAGRR